MKKLAINGGKKVREKLFPAYITVGEEEKKAVSEVIESGILSKYLGFWHDNFYGGEKVRKLEKEWEERFNVKHAIAVNSATSALYCAVGAIGAGPGDEIIVSPFTMTSSAVAALIYNAIPVFADIEKDYFCLDPDSIEEKITERTKAIIVVDIFGLPYDVERINSIAKKHGLYVIEDAAQAIGAKYKEKFAGTLGDIGIFSLNYHKNIHCGEGGIITTDNDELAEKMRMIRNHAEAVVVGKGTTDLVNMIGFNYRMTEVEAAIASEQLKKLDYFTSTRVKNVEYLSKELSKIPCLEIPKVRPNCTHAYYVQPIIYKKDLTGISREKFIDAVKAELPCNELREAEGVRIGCGYSRPLYLQPLYQELIAFGDKGCPFKCHMYKGSLNYEKGICPVCEEMYEEKIFVHEIISSALKKEDLDDVIEAFNKVWNNRSELI